MKTFLKNVIISIITIELFAFILINFFNYTNLWYKYPTYLYWGSTVKETYDPQGIQYIDSTIYSWGTWHKPNSTFRHKQDCFDAKINFNEIGGRGKLPLKNEPNLTIFLGDSFVHGFGLKEEETIPYQYSKFSGNPSLNLGGAGSFGSTQMRLIYDSLGNKFKHNKVIICQYLENDFVDDDILQYYPGRYRPYLIKNEQGLFNVIYKENYLNTVAKTSFYKGQNISIVKKYSIKDYFNLTDKKNYEKLAAFFYTPRFFLEIYYRISNKNKKPLEIQIYKNSLEIMHFNIKEIVKIAQKNNAKVYVVNIPSKYFISQINTQNNIVKVLSNIQDKYLNQIDVTKLDYLKSINNPAHFIKNNYFYCDSHFNPQGASSFSLFLSKNVK